MITRAALLYKQIDLVIRDDGGRLYDRGKENLSPLCNKTAATSPNMCNIEGKKELFILATLKFQKVHSSFAGYLTMFFVLLWFWLRY